ncbi:MAG: S8 family serine peptidase [Lentihominibacter sp.]
MKGLKGIGKRLLVAAVSLSLIVTSGVPAFATSEGEPVEEQTPAVVQDEPALVTDKGAGGDAAFATEASEPVAEAVNPVDMSELDIDKKEDTPAYKPNEAVVLLDESMSRKEVSSEMKATAQSISVEETGQVYGEDMTIALVESSMSTKSLVDKLNKQDNVIIAEPNYIYKATAATSDPYADSQWGYDACSVDVQRDKGSTGAEKVVAVVDTGVDYTNEDLQNVMWTNKYYPSLKGTHGYDFVNVDGSPLDDSGHGSHCAGIIAAERDNSTGVKGISDARIMAIKVLDGDGYGELQGILNGYNYILKAQSLGVNIVAVNNSWGGEGDSKILTEMIDLIGEGGALSVCAAGNEGMDNDEFESYPANCDSEYVISVASTGSDGELSSFSNYGDESVDIAAPGANIVSTVSYDNFFAAIYDEQARNKLTDYYYDCEGGMDSDVQVNALDSSAEEKASGYTVTESEGMNGAGKATTLTFNCRAGDLNIIRIPYTSGSDNPKHLSSLVNIGGPAYESGLYFVTDISRDESFADIYNDIEYYANKSNAVAEYLYQADETWWNIDYAEDEATGEDRYFCIGVYAAAGGNFTVTMDDLAVSRDVPSSEFGRYDVYSGTSMATPFVTGACALQSDEAGKDPTDIRASLLSHSDSSKILEVRTRGSLDFAKEQFFPNVRTATVKGGNIVISGFGLENAKIEIDGTEVSVLASSNKSATVKNNNLTNKVVTITATNDYGKAEREIYLVKGKKQFRKLETSGDEYDDYEDEGTAAMATNYVTDGRYVYMHDSDTVYRISASELKSGSDWEDLGMLDKSNFGNPKASNKKAEYGIVIGDSMAYANGRIYFIAGYGELTYADVEIGRTEIGGGWFMSDTEFRMDLYSGTYRLFSMSTSSGSVRAETKLPASVSSRDYQALAAYNGKIYVLGGYDYSGGKEALSAAVSIYNPSTKKWSTGPKMPSAGAEGQAIQCGDRLVYMAAASGGEPSLQVLKGSSWKYAAIKPVCGPMTIKKDTKTYNYYEGLLSNYRSGAIVTGIPTGYGDTFTYNVYTGKFSDTGYQYSAKAEYSDLNGLTIGSTFYVVNSDAEASVIATSSPLLKVTTSKTGKGKGKVTSTRYYVPGDKATVKAKASKRSYVASISVNGKVKKYKKKYRNRTLTVSSAITTDAKVKVRFKKKRR